MSFREQILQCQDIVTKKVEVPEWGGDVFVKVWDAGERMKGMSYGRAPDEIRSASIVAFAALDEAGQRIFTDDDIPALAKKSGDVLERIALTAIDLNGFNKVPEAKN